MEEKDKSETYLAVGSLLFQSFDELHANIKGRTNGFTKTCEVIHKGQPVSNFNITYEKTNLKERFIIELTGQEMAVLQNQKEAVANIKSSLPRFQKVGSLAEGAQAGQKYLGYHNIR